MDGEHKVLAIFFLVLGVIGTFGIWKGCEAERHETTQRQETLRACVASGKPPLECKEAASR